MYRTLIVGLVILLTAARAGAEPPFAVKSSRVAEISAWLSEEPRGVGAPITDREAWQAIASSAQGRDAVDEAWQFVAKPMRVPDDELYLEFSRNGNRSRYQKVLGDFDNRLAALVLAECLENRGRFIGDIEECLRAYCTLKSWTLPAHDRQLQNHSGRLVEIDLHAAQQGWNLATVAYWMGDKLAKPVRQQLAAELERRVLQPFEQAVRVGEPRLGWVTTTNNWNAVCLAGVAGTALAQIDSQERRAWFIAAAQESIKSFLSGFTADGYCSEGLGYWNYGFGHFLALSEIIERATSGRLDLASDPRVDAIARFGRRMEILPGVYPAFADCHLGTRPSDSITAVLSRRYGWGLADVEARADARALSGDIYEVGLAAFRTTGAKPAQELPPVGLRDWFEVAGIMIARPARPDGLGVALKGGHNAEHHNHNDLGSFVVALGGQSLLVDPGSEIYTARTFSGKRYESRLLNSYGHPVPRVAGRLQETGRTAEARLLKTDFQDSEDILSFDLTSAYKVPTLRSLKRTFRFSRQGRGALTIVDEVEFASAETFGTALVTFEPWRKTAHGKLVVGGPESSVEVTVDSGGAPLRLSAEAIDEDTPEPTQPVRLGIDLEKPVTRATVKVVIRPLGG